MRDLTGRVHTRVRASDVYREGITEVLHDDTDDGEEITRQGVGVLAGGRLTYEDAYAYAKWHTYSDTGSNRAASAGSRAQRDASRHATASTLGGV